MIKECTKANCDECPDEAKKQCKEFNKIRDRIQDTDSPIKLLEVMAEAHDASIKMAEELNQENGFKDNWNKKVTPSQIAGIFLREMILKYTKEVMPDLIEKLDTIKAMAEKQNHTVQ